MAEISPEKKTPKTPERRKFTLPEPEKREPVLLEVPNFGEIKAPPVPLKPLFEQLIVNKPQLESYRRGEEPQSEAPEKQKGKLKSWTGKLLDNMAEKGVGGNAGRIAAAFMKGKDEDFYNVTIFRDDENKPHLVNAEKLPGRPRR